jgi:2-dehydropantoate 2-reductase
MRICVFGAGAVGGYLAASLAQGDADVSVVARGAHLAAIRANGLTVETSDTTINARIAASDDPAALGSQDAVIVTVKAPALPAVAKTIAPLIGPATPVAFPMNGIPWWYFHAHGRPLDGRRLPLLDPDDALWRAVGPERAIGGIFWPACSVRAPGVVRLLAGAGGGTVLGEPNGQVTPRIEALAAAFRAADLPVTITRDIRTLIWRKLAFNLSAGPMCVLTESAVCATHEEPALIECSRRMVAEAMAVAAAMGHPLDIGMERVVAGNTRLAHRPSILQDLEAGRPMEIDALYTVPLELARLAGVPTPTLDLLAAMIRLRARAAGLYPPA